MFFAAFFWAFFDSALFPNAATGFQWPPEGIVPVEAFGLPLLMTMVLLLSGCTVTWAHHALREGHNKEAAQALAITVGLGIFFSIIQGYEYVHRSEEHTSELQSLMRISYAVFGLKKKTTINQI